MKGVRTDVDALCGKSKIHEGRHRCRHYPFNRNVVNSFYLPTQMGNASIEDLGFMNFRERNVRNTIQRPLSRYEVTRNQSSQRDHQIPA